LLTDQSIHDAWGKKCNCFMLVWFFILVPEWVSCSVKSIIINTQADLATFTH
jgi:hypothetical protein